MVGGGRGHSEWGHVHIARREGLLLGGAQWAPPEPGHWSLLALLNYVSAAPAGWKGFLRPGV